MTSNRYENIDTDGCCSYQVIFPPHPKCFWEGLGKSWLMVLIANLLFCLLVFLAFVSIIETVYETTVLPEFYTYNPFQVQH